MKYNWDMKKLKTLEKKHLQLLRKTQGLTKEEKKRIKEQISTIKELKEIIEPKIFSIEKLKDIISKKNRTFETYLGIPKEIRSWVLNAMHTFHEFEDTHNDIDLPTLNLSNKELVELSHDFFKWLPNKSYIHIFEKFTNSKNHLLRFQNWQQSSGIIGTTYPFYYPHYIPYFLINREKTILDFSTLNHEMAHGIYLSCQKHTSFENHAYFFELEGYFFDFLSLEFLYEKKIISENILQEIDFHECITAIDSFISFYIVFLGTYLYTHKQKIKIQSLYKKIIEHDLSYLIHENSLYYYFGDDPENSAKYALSYLINVDLETIYHKDPQYAFYLFEQIRKNKQQNIEKTLEQNQITFMHDHYKNLNQKLRKLDLIKK